ncbi:MFS transporter [Plantibacter sp. YIM 135249]|uniref:MFS transporter n=1 Tax=Plantibacter sp. YIM 135249 TaxID=3423918 RepID=UPI003D32B6C0
MSTEPRSAFDVVAVQRRTVVVLVSGQILGGLGFGAALSMGALLAASVSGSDEWSGFAATMTTLGAAAAAVPLARLAQSRGRRNSLAAGAGLAAIGSALVIVAAVLGVFPLLLLALACIGVGSAANLQARFAASDLATPTKRGRDLSIVVWATTIGSVIGPNLVGVGALLARMVGIPELAGPFLFAIVSQLLAVVLYLSALRPDPLLVSLANAASAAAEPGAVPASTHAHAGVGLRFAILAVALSHAVMVAVMAMTPVHLQHHGASISVIGLTISLHIAGMYGLSPVFGILSDRFGRVAVVFLGQGLFLAALLVAALFSDDSFAVGVGLVLLGLGWSASTVAGSALVTELSPAIQRTRYQGITDLLMSLAGAVGGALAGLVLALSGYAGLALWCLVLVGVVVVAGVLVRGRLSGGARGRFSGRAPSTQL